ncbi:MAG: glutamine-hydrolyzing GMP synthase [Chitinivibrionales bacterium]|nr:glutamine-hydrolyzing GMP synthase [Chitinivibrionales bacterium]
MKNRDTIAILDFGGQYTHLIANRIRRLEVYSEILPADSAPEALKDFKGIIISGGPYSVIDPDSPAIDPKILELGIPVLGLCYGHQLIAKILGGTVKKGAYREYGIAHMKILNEGPLFEGLDDEQEIWMSHGDSVDRLPEGFEILASTPDCAATAVGNHSRQIYGLQFHPEVTHTPKGMDILSNFISICKCKRSWNPKAFVEEIAKDIRTRCKGKKVFLLVSGGVDSTVAFTLLNQVLGPHRVLGLHVDNGLMRKDESETIMEYLHSHGFNNLKIEDATDDFLGGLDGIADPEKKREIIGALFIETKEKAEQKLEFNIDEWLLGQGTIYPDTIESAGTQHADKIKTHHNRVDIILELIKRGAVIEPLAQLYKDEVRMLGEELTLPHSLVWRHPFPGPGLGVRVLCSDRTEENVDPSVVQQAEKIAKPQGYRVRVLPVRSVGVQGDSRSYAHPALLTGPKNWDALEKLSTVLTNRVSGINRVIYNLSSEDSPYTLIKAFLTRERLDLLREIDHLVTETLKHHNEYDRIWQMPVVLLPLVNKSGEQCVVLRPVLSQEAMTARFAPLSEKALAAIVEGAAKIRGIGPLFFDVTNKPPGTIEWE